MNAQPFPVRGQSLFDRVAGKIAFPVDLDQCWLWVGAKSTKRNGTKRPVIQEGGRGSSILNVARIICQWYHGPPPDGAEAGHTCPQGENSLCVNPRHLEWMSRLENEHYKQTYIAA